MINIVKLLENENTNRKRKLSLVSIAIYKTNLELLNKIITGDDKIQNIDFVKDVDKVLEALSVKALNTRKNYITSIVVMLKALGEDELYDRYTALMDMISKQVEDKYDENEKTENQKNNWVDYIEILKLLNKYKTLTRPLFRKDKDDLTNKEKDLIQQHLVLYLYSGKAFPIIRNDFADMKIVDDKDKLEDKKNYLVISNNKRSMRFQLNEFKTKNSKTNIDKPFIIQIKDAELKSLIRKWIDIANSEYLLINLSGNQYKGKGTPMSANGITKYLQKIFMKHLNKKISTSLLRSIYITNKYKNNTTTKEKKELAQDMLHSKSTAESVYNKMVE
jgi:hypothetical protein